MSENGNDPVSVTDGKSKRRPAAYGVFPRLSLQKALELARAVYETGEGAPARRRSVFTRLNRSADSGAARSLIAAANSGYGLVTGSANSEHFGLTEIGKRLVAPTSALAAREAAFDVLFSNALFANFVDHFRDKSIKNEEVPIDYLRQKHKLSEADAQACLAVFKENVSDFGLIEEHLGRPVIVSRDVAIANLKSTTGESASNLNGQSASPVGGSAFVGIHPAQSEQPAAATAGPDHAPRALDAASLPQFHFNIQIHLPESASAEVYDSIFRGISTHLLGRSGE